MTAALNYQIITSEGATAASTVTYLLPVVAIVLGVLVLGEAITVAALAGIALVLAGVALTRRRAKPATDEQQVGQLFRYRFGWYRSGIGPVGGFNRSAQRLGESRGFSMS